MIHPWLCRSRFQSGIEVQFGPWIARRASKRRWEPARDLVDTGRFWHDARSRADGRRAGRFDDADEEFGRAPTRVQRRGADETLRTRRESERRIGRGWIVYHRRRIFIQPSQTGN